MTQLLVWFDAPASGLAEPDGIEKDGLPADAVAAVRLRHRAAAVVPLKSQTRCAAALLHGARSMKRSLEDVSGAALLPRDRQNVSACSGEHGPVER